MHYETEENYYVFINALSVYSFGSDHPGNVAPIITRCLPDGVYQAGYQYPNPSRAAGGPPKIASISTPIHFRA